MNGKFFLFVGKVIKSGLNQVAMLERGGNSTIQLNLN